MVQREKSRFLSLTGYGVMSIHVKFKTSDKPEFYTTLRRRVNQYFEDNNISKFGNRTMVIKTIIMLGIYFIPLALFIFASISNLALFISLWILMGFGMSGIGMSVMHDANHGSYSKNRSWNKRIGFLVNFVGGYHVNWIIQHNILHHSFTNIHEHDEDIEQKVMRFSPNQKRKLLYRFQAYYAPLLYSFMTLYWYLAKDMIQLISYHKNGLLQKQGVSFTRSIIVVTIYKLGYLALLLALPLYYSPLAWWIVLLGFLSMHFVSGLILALIFQPAHVLEETSFFKVDHNQSVENSWAVHQLRTTSNFAPASKGFSWFIGGLNYQIEHHLFPTVCHIHYSKIAPIVKATAEEYGIPYYEHKTFYRALKSHFSLLHKLGTGKYEKELKLAS